MRLMVAAVLFGGLVLALAGCGGGSSSSGGEGTTTSAVATDTTATTEATSTDTTATSTVVNAGETATWRGDAFTVSDVETSDTAPVPDLLGEKPKAEIGVWLSFKITPAEDNSDIWSTEFTDSMQIRGGDGKIYGCGGAVYGCSGPVSEQSMNSSAGVQDELGESDFLVWVDIPEAALSGAVLEITDALSRPGPNPPTLVNLGL